MDGKVFDDTALWRRRLGSAVSVAFPSARYPDKRPESKGSQEAKRLRELDIYTGIGCGPKPESPPVAGARFSSVWRGSACLIGVKVFVGPVCLIMGKVSVDPACLIGVKVFVGPAL